MTGLRVTAAAAERPERRRGPWVILLLAVAPLSLWLAIAATKPLAFDDALHVLIARTGGLKWVDLRIALRGDAHPPLFYLALKALLTITSGRVIDRAIPVVAGAGAVFLFGLILRRLGVRPWLYLLGTVAFGFSASIGSLATAVRAYTPSIAGLLLAFAGLVELGSENRARSSILAGILTAGACLAFWMEYAAAFVVGSLAVSAAAWAASSRGAVVRGRLRQSRAVLIGGAAALAVSGAASYRLNIRYWAHPLNHLPGYYYGDVPGERLAAYFARTSAAEVRLFVPGWITDSRLALWIGLLLAAFSIWGAVAAWRNPRSGAGATRALPAAIAAGTLLAIAAAGAARVYPLGAGMRHQAVLYPFALLSAFVALDELWRLAHPLARGVLAITVCGAVLWNSALGVADLRHVSAPILADAVAERAASYPERTIIAGQYSAVAVLAHFDRFAWTYLFHAGQHGELEVIRIERPGAPVLVVRSNKAWILPLQKDSAWEIVAMAFEDLGLSCATVAEAGGRHNPPNAAPVEFEADVRSAASRAGLVAKVDDADSQPLVHVCRAPLGTERE